MCKRVYHPGAFFLASLCPRYGRWPSPGSPQLKLNSFQNSGEFSAARRSTVVHCAENSQQREIQSIDLGADPPVRRSCSLCKTNNNLKLGGGGGGTEKKRRGRVSGFSEWLQTDAFTAKRSPASLPSAWKNTIVEIISIFSMFLADQGEARVQTPL